MYVCVCACVCVRVCVCVCVYVCVTKAMLAFVLHGMPPEVQRLVPRIDLRHHAAHLLPALFRDARV